MPHAMTMTPPADDREDRMQYAQPDEEVRARREVLREPCGERRRRKERVAERRDRAAGADEHERGERHAAATTHRALPAKAETRRPRTPTTP